MATDDVSPMPTAVDGAAEESIITTPWMLLELFAYFKDVENATTAATTTSDKKHIQITFCTRPPPFLSRFYIYSRDGASIRGTPFVLSMEDDLVLIRVAVGGFGGLDYYVYQADDGSGKPSLTLLPKIPDGLYFHPKDIGLLRCRRPGSTGKEYMVAGFRYMPLNHPGGGFKLCLYDSKRADWKVYALMLSLQGREEYRKAYEKKVFLHQNCKVVTIGGEGGTMAFVDLWRGVLLCDVLQVEGEAARRARQHKSIIPILGYVPLPDDLRKNAKVDSDARLFRDIAFLDGHLKCVDLLTRSLWIRPAATDFSVAWSQKYKIASFKAIEDSNPSTNLLPGHQGMYRPSFRHLLVCQPAVGLEDDGRILYFTVKTHETDAHASVVAVDMMNKKILGVASFFSRFEIVSFIYMHARLSKHLMNIAPGAQGILKQSGMVSKESSSKTMDAGAQGILEQSGMVSRESSSNIKDEVQEQQSGEVQEHDDSESVAEGYAMTLD